MTDAAREREGKRLRVASGSASVGKDGCGQQGSGVAKAAATVHGTSAGVQ